MGKGKRVKRGKAEQTFGGFRIIASPENLQEGVELVHIKCDRCREEKIVEKWEIAWMDQNLKKRLCVPCQIDAGLMLGGHVEHS